MTDRGLQGLLERWRHRLALRHWDIELRGTVAGGEHINENTLMRALRHVSYERAVVYYADWLIGVSDRPAEAIDVTMTDQRIEITLVHELLHLYTARITDCVEDDLDGMLHRDVHAVLKAGQDRAEEWMVDTLARALVRAFDPLERAFEERS